MSTNNAIAIIPSRYKSSRFEGKPLAMIDNKTMIQWVYEATLQAKFIDEVIVATDDERIYNNVLSFSGKAIMTSPDINNGTERCYCALQTYLSQNHNAKDFNIVINVQGDEPLIKPQMIDSVVAGFDKKDVDIVTLKKVINDLSELNDPNVVKLVCTNSDKAMYFSRSAIPFARDNNSQALIDSHLCYKHIGIYGYRSNILKEIIHLDSNSLEQIEKLEQLRWLANGYNIKAITTTHDTIGVDTKEDLNKIITIINNTK